MKHSHCSVLWNRSFRFIQTISTLYLMEWTSLLRKTQSVKPSLCSNKFKWRTFTIGRSINVQLVSSFTSLDSTAYILIKTYFLSWSNPIFLNWTPVLKWYFPLRCVFTARSLYLSKSFWIYYFLQNLALQSKGRGSESRGQKRKTKIKENRDR